YSPRLAVFWRGSFLFQIRPSCASIMGTDEFTQFVHRLTAAITMENLLPVSITHLPKEGMKKHSIRFYLGADSIRENSRFPKPLREAVGFSEHIEVASAEYEPDAHSLFLVGYPNPKLADEYFLQMQDQLQSFFSTEGVYMKRSGLLICLFIGPEQQATTVLQAVKYNPSIKWLYEKKEDPNSSEIQTFFGLLTQTILGIGTFLLMIIGSGLIAGLLRYEFLRRFPGLSRKKGTIRLNLD
ncbi:MAG: hypothetical protein JSU96_03455, partial [Acidobacteriota bacterium]